MPATGYKTVINCTDMNQCDEESVKHELCTDFIFSCTPFTSA